jgi:hypothetical protein
MPRTADRRFAVLGFIAGACTVGVMSQGPIPQDPAYHAFSDQRTILGVPHFWNVVSNAPFLLAGVLGLLVVARRPPGMVAENSRAYALFFLGAILIAIGSAWYHLDPTNATLVWDRLPMTISLMAFVAIVIGEHVDVGIARRVLLPLVAVGIASAAYWGVSERLGRSDLRPYAIVQFLPMVLIPLILLMYPSRLTKPWIHWLVFASYAVAKVLELLDGGVHRALGFASGHSLKHVAAAAAMFILVLGLRSRVPAAGAPRDRLAASAIGDLRDAEPRG